MESTELPAYHFMADWSGTRTGFSEISGLSMNVSVTELTNGADPMHSTRKIPGRMHYSNIILKRGIVKGDSDFYNWMQSINMSTVDRRNIVVSLLDENHLPVVSWKIKNAFPVRFSGPILIANASSIAIEELELTHEGFTMEMS